MTPTDEDFYSCLPSPTMPKAKPSAQPKPVWPPPLPPDASEEARAARIAAEEEAKRVSDQIDKNLGAERERKRSDPQTKILLLGQAESGKSTVLKNFQLHFSPDTFDSETEVWRPIIHLNLVRSVNFILKFLSRTSRNSSSSYQPLYDSLSGDLRRLCIGLAPLREVEASLTRSLSDSAASQTPNAPTYNPAKASEVSLRPSSGWKNLLMGRRQLEKQAVVKGSHDDADRRILAACADDITKLWRDPVVQNALRSREISLQDQPGFFLDDVDRVTRSDYMPTSADVLRARITTLGPEEHRIKLEYSSDSQREWIIYDVGGSRSQRAVWAQYFDDVHVIIFLAPLSGFNQVLAEDRDVNRLSDSLKLWQMICSNKLLASVELILFLNKLDVLDAKLRSGVQFSRYVKPYTGRPNDTKSVAKYLLEVFMALHQQNTPRKRKIHPHLTCAIDTKATSSVIDRIHEIILVKALSDINIL